LIDFHVENRNLKKAVKMKLYSVFVLRCQPFHNAHKKIIHESLNQTDEIIIIVGSSRSSITVKNPWTFEERKSFILGSFSEEQSKKIHVFSVADLLYSSHTWITSIQNIVNNVVQSNDIVTLVGHYKDDSSYYLNWFPQWKLQTLPYFKNDDHDSIDGTEICCFKIIASGKIMCQKMFQFLLMIL